MGYSYFFHNFCEPYQGIFEFLYYVVTPIAILLTIQQISLHRDANNLQIFEKIYSDNTKIRENFIDALAQLEELNKKTRSYAKEIAQKTIKPDNLHNKKLAYRVKRYFLRPFKFIPIRLQYLLYRKIPENKTLNQKCSTLCLTYNNINYKKIREIAIHYEFIGVLVKHKMLPFNLVFDLITFPDDIWNNSQDLIKVMREYWLPDFWENFEFLHDKYMLERMRRKIG